jgi:hypothetical protein
VRSSECIAVAIDTTTGELLLPPHFVHGVDAVRVLAWAAVRCGRGEFFADLDNPADLPLSPSPTVTVEGAWFGGRAPPLAEIEAQFRRTLAAVPGVGSVVSLRVEARPRRAVLVETVLRSSFDDVPPTQVVISG